MFMPIYISSDAVNAYLEQVPSVVGGASGSKAVV